jgi:mono/diheme cytochrome c family protein
MRKLVLRHILVVACGAALVGGCGSSDAKKDASVPRDTGVDAARDGAIDAAVDRADGASPDGGNADRPEGGSTDAPGDGVVLTAQEERGRYLVQNVGVCGDCHTPRDPMTQAPIMAQYLAGAECFVRLPNGHCLPTRNLTNHETGLRNRSPDEIKRMFLDGIRPASGAALEVALNPVMPYFVFHNMTAADADAIVAYLRTVPGVDHGIPSRAVEFDVPVHADYLDPLTIPTPAVTFPEAASATRGRYLATQAGVCLECHTQRNPPAMPPNPVVLDPTRFFAGGEVFDVGFPVIPVSTNLTSDLTTGLGSWSATDIVRVLKDGKDRNDKGICPPMPVGPMGAYGGLTDQDARDIANYIKSLPPKVNLVVDMCTFPFPPPPDGGIDGSPDGSDASSDAAGDAQD